MWYVQYTLTQNEKMKTLYIIFKSIYFDDELIFGGGGGGGVSVTEKKFWMKIRNCIIFMNNSVERGQNENF